MTASHIPIGVRVLGADGVVLGHVGALYTDNATGFPVWASVTGPGHTVVVPLERSRFDGQVLHVAFDAEQVATAPHHDPATLITYPDGDDLARHYGLIPLPDGDTAPAPPESDDGRGRGKSGTGVETDIGTGEMVLSQEQLRVGAVNVMVGRARLVTSIVTEQQTFTIPVRRQEVRLVIDPIPAHDQVVSDTAPAEETYEVICHAEQVLFTTQVVPVERVRMVRRVIITEQSVAAEVRSEQLDLTRTAHDQDGPPGGGPAGS